MTNITHTGIRTFSQLLFTLCVLVTSGTVQAAGSGGNDDYPVNSRGLSTEQRSAKAFRAGLKYRDRALKHEARAAQANSDQARDRSLAKAAKDFRKAVEKQGEAVKLFPQNYKAANELGFALRKTGAYRKAIGAYNYALEINPNFHQATEYRGEAYLALGMYEQTQQAYMRLFRNDRALADQLMASIDTWLSDKAEPLDPAEAEFVAWVAQRKRLAKITSDLSQANTRSW